MTELKEEFKEQLIKLLGHREASRLIEVLDEPPITSVRFNKRKPGAEFPESIPVPWCKSGVYIPKRPEFILDPLLHAGAYYVQDASSMIYEALIEILIKKLHPLKPLKVLDLCAAPGGKSSAMINALNDVSIIVANEYSPKRVGILKENLFKWGFQNVTITNHDSSFFARQEEAYDIVAVDAPCSGEGMMRKEDMARVQWSEQLVMKCSVLQKDILRNAEKALKPGGFLIYSTCTFNKKENEENAEFIVKELGLIPFDPDFPKEWGIPRGIDTDLPVYRFMPHITQGEGLFLSVFRKEGQWQPSDFQNYITEKKEGNDYPKIDVDEATALSYLRGESIVLPAETPRGMVTITFKGLPLGEAKNIGSRANNHYPKSWRILKR